MDQPLSAEQLEHLLERHPVHAYLVFPEDRTRPIRREDELPAAWADGPTGPLRGEARPGEYYAYQLGVYAARRSLENLTVHFFDLAGEGGAIPAASQHCLNTGGRDWAGRVFTKAVSVPLGELQALWCGVQVPEDASGRYEGVVSVQPEGLESVSVPIELTVAGEPIAEHGDQELWRHSRLRWLDADIALDDDLIAPYVPLEIKGRAVTCLGRRVELDGAGLPADIRSYFTMEMTGVGETGRPLLAMPMAFVVETDQGPVAWSGGEPRFCRLGPAAVEWESSSQADGFEMHTQARMEQEGFIAYRLTLTARKDATLRDARLEVPFARDAAVYAMGMGRVGGYRPESHDWKWEVSKHQDCFWVGDVNAGLQLRLKGPNYVRPYVNIYYDQRPLHIPADWDNDGKGGGRLREQATAVMLQAYSGERAVRAGETLHFHFDLYLTPFRPIDPPARFAMRYYHSGTDMVAAAQAGANIANIHHANEVNPWINYPFLTVDRIADLVRQGHDLGLKVKFYYTVRELSNRTVELWALRSLGGEVIAPGEGEGVPGQGGADDWLVTHLRRNYIPAWKHVFTEGELKGEVDASLLTTSLSRWHNYYLEGLDYLLRHTRMDGLYIDDTSYDRDVMKRVRKILDRRRPGSLIDFHTWNHFNDMAGWACCANVYMELFPFIDSTWIGEGRNYTTPPDYWMVEIASIPYGLMGEMLEGGGNPWRGMIYGMTARLPWSGNPRPIWQAWDEFGIGQSHMIGYWAPSCPVRPDHPDVLATVYQREGKALIALASWAAEPVEVHLHMDWERLGLRSDQARLQARAIEHFQEAREFDLSGAIPVEPGRGWLLLLDEDV